MYVITRSRAGGKTTTLINMMRKDPDMIMLCIDQRAAESLRQKYPDISRRRFIASEDVRRLYGMNYHLVVDDLDYYLQMLFHSPLPIVAVSITGEAE